MENKNNIMKTESNLLNNYQSNTSHNENNNLVKSNSRFKVNSKQSSPNIKTKANSQPKN